MAGQKKERTCLKIKITNTIACIKKNAGNLFKEMDMNNADNMTTVKRIAITSQENKKTDLIEWSYFRREALAKHKLIATGTTADILEGTINVPVQKILSGTLGGYRQLAELIEQDKIDAIIFFSDTIHDALNNTDVKHLLETAISKNILLCCNRTTADYVLESLLMNQAYTIEGPGYSPKNQKEVIQKKDDEEIAEIKLAV